MNIIVEGVVMESVIEQKKDRDGKYYDVRITRLFQPGQKKLVEVKEGPEYETGEKVQIPCRMFPWANDRGHADVSLKFNSNGNGEIGNG